MDTCPECGISLEGIDIAAHAEQHWPEYARGAQHYRVNKEAQRRYAALVKAASRQKLPKPDEEAE